MKKIELINNSYLGISSYVGSDTKLAELEQYITANKPIFDQFKGIIVASNYQFTIPFKERTHELWNKYFDDVTFLDLDVNRGHTFGTLDLDGIIFDVCKENNIEWLFKVNDDMIYYPEFLEGEVPEADFYYYNGIGYGGMEKYNYDIDKIVAEDFYPQTIQYFINTSKLPYIHNKQVVTNAYDIVTKQPNYSGKPWEYIDNFSCEDLLKNAVIKNSLSKHMMIEPTTYIRLLNYIKANQIHDPSHKQLIIDGTLHFQEITDKVIKI